MASKNRLLKRLFVHNWGLKLLALALAVLSFQAVRSVTSDTVRHDIPLTVEVEPGIAVHSQDPQTVKVMFRGSEEDLRRLEKEGPRVIIKPKAADPEGTEEVPIRPKHVESVPGVTVVKLEPMIATLKFDREIEIPMAVAPPRVIGTPEIGEAEISYEPKTVKVRGPKRRMENRKFVEVNTESVDVGGRVSSFTKWVPVIPPREWVSAVEPSEVTVKVTIVTESVTKSWTNVVVAAVVKPDTGTDIFLEPSVVDLVLQGRAEVMDGITQDSVRVFVDCMGLSHSASYELPVNVHFPPGVNVKADVQPDTVKVVIKQR